MRASCVRAYVRACMRASERASVRACVRASVRALAWTYDLCVGQAQSNFELLPARSHPDFACPGMRQE